MLHGLLVILTCQLGGQFIATSLQLRIPGPILGMALFLAVLLVRHQTRAHAPAYPSASGSTSSGDHWGPVQAADRLLTYLPLFFVPAGVGVIQYGQSLCQQWLPVLAGLLGAWVVALLTTAFVAVGIGRLPQRQREQRRRRQGATS